MKSSDVYKAIGEVEDSLIEPQAKKSASRKRLKHFPKKFRILAAACLAIVLVWVAVFSPIFHGYKGEVYAKSLMKGMKANDVTGKEEDQQFSEALSEYSINLFKNSMKLKDSHTNRLVSPYSLLLALAMTANGAEEDTRAQMEKIMGDIPLTELNEYLYSFNKKLTDKKSLTLANSIWYRDDKDRLEVKAPFLQINADYYGADAYSAPFDGNTLKDMNAWVKKNTDGNIDKILDQIPKYGVMYLFNTLLFDAKWETTYKKNDVDDCEFTNYAGDKYQVPMMYGGVSQLLAGDNVNGFLKDYEDNQFSFVALLPKEGMSVDDYIETLTGKEWSRLMSSKTEEYAESGIPKFKFEDSLLLNEALKSMGMQDAFDTEKANFKGMANSSLPAGNIYLSKALQYTFIEVAEKGTKAGAVSSIQPGDTAAAPAQNEIILDRPFVYAIVDKSTGVPIFMGAVKDIQD